MATIFKGMTPVEYLAAVNSAFDSKIVNYTTLTGTTNEATTINNNFTDSIITIGDSGSTFINAINNKFDEYDNSLSTPTDLSVVWVDDFARITFSSSENQCEIWEQLDGGNYVLCNTLNAGVGTYDYKCWQNSSYNFRLRFKNNNLYSAFAEKISIDTPQFVFYTDQSEYFVTITIHELKSVLSTGAEGTNRIYWGDGTYNDYTSPAFNAAAHVYSTPGKYFIKIYGDPIWALQFYEQHLDGTDISKWKIPNTANGFHGHLWDNGFIGDISEWTYPETMSVFHFANNPITGSLDKLFDGSCQNLFDFHAQGTQLYGNLSNWMLPSKLAHFGPPVYVYGDISHFRFPRNNDYKSWIFSLSSEVGITGDVTNIFIGTYEYLHSMSIADQGLYGDWSGLFIGVNYLSAGSISLNGNHFIKCPRGNFYKMDIFNFADNNCNQTEIDAILADIDANVTTNAPMYDCAYSFNGAGMGIPSAAGLASKSSIEEKYTAAGKTATITVNT